MATDSTAGVTRHGPWWESYRPALGVAGCLLRVAPGLCGAVIVTAMVSGLLTVLLSVLTGLLFTAVATGHSTRAETLAVYFAAGVAVQQGVSALRRWAQASIQARIESTATAEARSSQHCDAVFLALRPAALQLSQMAAHLAQQFPALLGSLAVIVALTPALAVPVIGAGLGVAFVWGGLSRPLVRLDNARQTAFFAYQAARGHETVPKIPLMRTVVMTYRELKAHALASLALAPFVAAALFVVVSMIIRANVPPAELVILMLLGAMSHNTFRGFSRLLPDLRNASPTYRRALLALTAVMTRPLSPLVRWSWAPALALVAFGALAVPPWVLRLVGLP